MFPADALSRIETSVARGERQHGAQLRVVIEARLGAASLRARLAPRARALQVFSEQRVWDTEGNNGVLLYLLLADRAVEIVADRAAARRIDSADWAAVCNALTRACADGHWVEGTESAIERIHALLAVAFPVGDEQPKAVDELPNRPLVI